MPNPPADCNTHTHKLTRTTKPPNPHPPPPTHTHTNNTHTHTRTPQAKRGGLKDTSADELLVAVFEATLAATGVNPADIGDVVVGSVLGDSSQRAIQARTPGLECV